MSFDLFPPDALISASSKSAYIHVPSPGGCCGMVIPDIRRKQPNGVFSLAERWLSVPVYSENALNPLERKDGVTGGENKW